MPVPRYIICSQVRLVDQLSGLLTHVNVLEVLTCTVYEQQPSAKELLKSRQSPIFEAVLTAVWMKEDSDAPDRVFDVELLAYSPEKNEPTSIGIFEVSFVSWFVRVEANMRLTVHHPGLLKFAGRIRDHGTDQWMAQQQFLVPVEFVSTKESEPPAST